MSSAESHETNIIRLSIRTTKSNLDKLVAIAKERGWVNAKGKPNLSRTLNYVIDRFETKKGK
jgi:hypothetical protein